GRKPPRAVTAGRRRPPRPSPRRSPDPRGRNPGLRGGSRPVRGHDASSPGPAAPIVRVTSGCTPLLPFPQRFPIPRSPAVPLDFLKRKNTDATTDATAAPSAPPRGPHGPITLPEEVVAQEYQLKLYYAGKSSEGVRMQTGPNAINELPSMLHGLARTEIEVVEPLPIEFSQATPVIARPSEAMQWLNAHHVHSPVTRHALVVLESIDAIDLAFDTFVCTLL